ncbi:MAG: hypothetical protein QM751_15575 [Paludibacteraceae bacterium]
MPVQSVTASPTFDGSFLREYSETKNATDSYYNKWITLNKNNTLTQFKGYEITQNTPKFIGIQGDLVLCNQQITLTRTATTVMSSTDTNENNSRYGLGQNVFGNSFTAAIDISAMNFPTNVQETVYMYNTGSFGDWNNETPTSESSNAGTYKAIPKNVANTLAYGKIPSMQGFLLRHIGTTSDPIAMTLPYANVVANNKPQLAPRQKSANEDLSYLEIGLTSASTRDKMWLFSQKGTSAYFDNGWDGMKFFGTQTAFIYAPTPDGNMQINTTRNISVRTSTLCQMRIRNIL